MYNMCVQASNIISSNVSAPFESLVLPRCFSRPLFSSLS
jgi:hypothetical protein